MPRWWRSKVSCYGASDLPADAAATRDAGQAAWSGSCRLGLPMHVHRYKDVSCWRSPRKRCGPTMLKTDARLREFDFGRWERRRWADIGRAEFDAWLADFAQGRPGGGENVTELMARVAEAWGDWRAGGRDALMGHPRWRDTRRAPVGRWAAVAALGGGLPAEGLAFGAADGAAGRAVAVGQADARLYRQRPSRYAESRTSIPAWRSWW